MLVTKNKNKNTKTKPQHKRDKRRTHVPLKKIEKKIEDI